MCYSECFSSMRIILAIIVVLCRCQSGSGTLAPSPDFTFSREEKPNGQVTVRRERINTTVKIENFLLGCFLELVIPDIKDKYPGKIPDFYPCVKVPSESVQQTKKHPGILATFEGEYLHCTDPQTTRGKFATYRKFNTTLVGTGTDTTSEYTTTPTAKLASYFCLNIFKLIQDVKLGLDK
jgi:hypothetical protein